MTIPPLTIMPATSNLVANPWFAVNTTGWVVGGGTLARVTDRALQGPASLQLTATGVDARLAANMTIPASPYVVTFWVWHSLGSSRSFVAFYNSVPLRTQAIPSGGSAWTPVSIAVTGTGASAPIQIRLPDSVAGETYHVGHVLVEPGDRRTAPCPEIDAAGNLLPGSDWTGTPHASSSTRAEKRILGSLSVGSPHIGPLRVGKD